MLFGLLALESSDMGLPHDKADCTLQVRMTREFPKAAELAGPVSAYVRAIQRVPATVR